MSSNQGKLKKGWKYFLPMLLAVSVLGGCVTQQEHSQIWKKDGGSNPGKNDFNDVDAQCRQQAPAAAQSGTSSSDYTTCMNNNHWFLQQKSTPTQTPQMQQTTSQAVQEPQQTPPQEQPLPPQQ